MQRAQVVSRLVAQRHFPSIWRRLNSSSVSSRPFVPSSSALPARKPRDAAEARIGYDGRPTSIRVQFWHSPRDSADVLATIQHIEQLYGPIDEFNCPSLNSDRKSLTLFIRFRDQESASRATAIHDFHRIPVPDIPRPDALQGGVSLAALVSLLDVKAYQPVLKPDLSEPDRSVKYDHREDAHHDIRSAPGRAGEQFLSRPAMRAFVEWAGFTSIRPLPKDTPLLEQGDAIDHPIMRHAVGRYAKMVGARNPLELIPQPTFNPAAMAALTSQSKLSAEEKTAVVSEPSEPTNDASGDINIFAEAPVVDPSTPSASTHSLPLSSSPSPSPKPSQAPSQLAKSPEAIAQLRIANSILKKIHKPNKAKTPTHQTKQNSTSHKSQKGLGSTASSTLSAKLKEQLASTQLKSEGKTEETEKNATTTSRLRGFMGNWF
ncbi:hypothetical protein J3R30DRAFT_3698336 [Lentinula aciculospora]|uniref:Uncharacterized protein n=1 Tax=Lentinula aciculospora TaxID=153920 RepID=A0A9W9AJY9_9AGAR|nr:hypothetical protein J3R30DRAFT_3698336 [Lentinula aciculospora]